MSLNRLNDEKNDENSMMKKTDYFYRNPQFLQISSFSIGQKGVLILRGRST